MREHEDKNTMAPFPEKSMGCFPHTHPTGLIGIGASKKSEAGPVSVMEALSLPHRDRMVLVDGEFAERIGAVMKRGLQPLV
jgi:hypothetical protein